MDKYEFSFWEEFQEFLHPAGIMWIFKEQTSLFAVKGNMFQKKEVILFPGILFFLADVLKQMILGKVAFILREVEGVNTASGSHSTESLLFFSRIIQFDLHIVLWTLPGDKNAQDLIQAVQAKKGKVHGKGLVVLQVAITSVTGHQIMQMGRACAPEAEDKKRWIFFEGNLFDLS
jgi:hypothetical protein